METLLFTKNIELRKTVDVFVAGGGPSGVAAAVSAARMGAKVFLIEAHSCFGGMGTAGLVPAFCQFGDGVNFLATGFGKEVYDKMFEFNGVGPDDQKGNMEICIKAEVLKRIYDDLVLKSGADFSFHTSLIDVQVKDGQVIAAICWAKGGIFAVKASIYIDCTGDGDLAAWAGAPFLKGDKNNMQPGTLCSMWTGIDWSRVKPFHERECLQKAIEEKIFTIADPHLPGMWKIGDNLGGGNIGHIFDLDSTNEQSITKSLVSARKQLLEYEQFYRNYVKGFENAKLIITAPMMGSRESRRILCDYVLTLEDFKNMASFYDEIGRYCYRIDLHSSKPDLVDYMKFKNDFEIYSYQNGQSYGIPYRVLVPQKLSNVLVAGRCVGTDRYMHSSIRVMPGCFITGQAAGVAAAIAARCKCQTREIKPNILKKELWQLGAKLRPQVRQACDLHH